MEFLALCRICLQNSVHRVVKNLQLQEVYEQLTRIPFQCDGRPLGLCYICYAQLRASHRFKMKCLQAEQVLAQRMLDDGEVLDPTLTAQSTINHLSFSAVEQTVIIDGDLQDVKTESVEIMIGYDVGLDEPSTEEAAYSIDLKPNKRPSVSDQRHKDPLIIEQKEPKTVRKKAPVRTRRGCKLKKAAPIAKKIHLKPDPETVKAEGETIRKDIKKPVFNDISNINRKKLTIEHDIQQNYVNNDDKKVDLIRNTKNNRLRVKRTYICDVCGRIFSRKYRLRNHICKQHIDKKPFICGSCPQSFVLKSHLKAHARKHTVVKKYVCDVCKMDFPKWNLLRRHHTQAHKTRVARYFCDVCKKGFFYKCQLVTHLQAHMVENQYVCNTCGEDFAKINRLRTHLARYGGPGVFICNICRKGFIVQSDLDRHACVPGKIACICPVCGKKYSSQTNLDKHIVIHSDRPRSYVCNVCNKSFMKNMTLKIHSRSHTGVRPYVCKVCGKGFMQSHTLLKHSWIHTGDRPFVCNVCGKGFRMASHLTVHSRTHSGERPYSCEQCGKAFTTKCNLTVHLRIHTAEKVRNKYG